MPRIEQSEEGEHEARGGAGRYHDALRPHGDAVALAHIAGDRLPEPRQSEGLGIAEPVAGERFSRTLARGPWRGRPRLAHFHMNNVSARLLARIRLPHHIHDDEGVDGASLGERAGQTFQARRRRVQLKGPRVLLKPCRASCVTLSPHSNANQSMFGKDMAGGLTSLARAP